MRLLLWQMFAGTRGGYNRGFILKYFIDKQYDLDQLAEGLSLDRKTTIHHLDILTKNGIITAEGDKGDKYGGTYFLSKAMEENLNNFNKIWEKIRIDEFEVRRNKNIFAVSLVALILAMFVPVSTLFLALILMYLFVPVSTLFLALILMHLFVPPIFALSTMLFQGISVISKELKRLPLSEKKIIVISI